MQNELSSTLIIGLPREFWIFGLIILLSLGSLFALYLMHQIEIQQEKNSGMDGKLYIYNREHRLRIAPVNLADWSEGLSLKLDSLHVERYHGRHEEEISIIPSAYGSRIIRTKSVLISGPGFWKRFGSKQSKQSYLLHDGDKFQLDDGGSLEYRKPISSKHKKILDEISIPLPPF